MALLTVSTWANGFGVWQARIHTTGAVGDERKARDLARKRIREELTLREGPSFNPRVIGTTLSARKSEAGMLTFYFTERIIGGGAMHR